MLPATPQFYIWKKLRVTLLVSITGRTQTRPLTFEKSVVYATMTSKSISLYLFDLCLVPQLHWIFVFFTHCICLKDTKYHLFPYKFSESLFHWVSCQGIINILIKTQKLEVQPKIKKMFSLSLLILHVQNVHLKVKRQFWFIKINFSTCCD